MQLRQRGRGLRRRGGCDVGRRRKEAGRRRTTTVVTPPGAEFHATAVSCITLRAHAIFRSSLRRKVDALKPRSVGFTAAQVDALVAQPKVIRVAPRLKERAGFARLESIVLVEDTRDIGLVMRAHVGLRVDDPSPNVVLMWSNVRVRGIDHAALHANVLDLPAVTGWHEHIWDDEHGDRRIVEVRPEPPLGLRSFFDSAAKRWNIRILRGNTTLEFGQSND